MSERMSRLEQGGGLRGSAQDATFRAADLVVCSPLTVSQGEALLGSTTPSRADSCHLSVRPEIRGWAQAGMILPMPRSFMRG